MHPFYDRYFLGFFRAIVEIEPTFTLIDIGANVGDTTVTVKSVAPHSRVICVEGSDHFLRYLRTNVESLSGVKIVDSFVTAGKEEGLEYTHSRGTGRLIEAAARPASEGIQFTTVGALLKNADEAGLLIWKSDTDGHDIGILLAGFDEIVSRSEIIWFELMLLAPYEPDPDELKSLFHRIGELDHDVVVVDNFGRVMLHISAASAPSVISDLGRWLRLQRASGTASIDYFDIWVMSVIWAKKLIESIPDPRQ